MRAISCFAREFVVFPLQNSRVASVKFPSYCSGFSVRKFSISTMARLQPKVCQEPVMGVHRFVFVLFIVWSFNVLNLIEATEGKLPGLEINITVSKSPKIVYQAEKLNHPEDTNATLMCSIGSGELDGLTYEWLKDGKRIAPSTRYRISIPAENYNSVLRVIALQPDDSATYTCIARNAFGQDKISIELFVQVQLKWVSEPKDVSVSAGKPLHVPCKADGSPAPRMEWSRLDENGLRAEQLGPELHFGSIQPGDSGQYECRARNGVEKDLVSRIKLEVLGK